MANGNMQVKKFVEEDKKNKIAKAIYNITHYNEVFVEINFSSVEEAKKFKEKLPKLFIAIKNGEVNVYQEKNTLIFYPSAKLAFKSDPMIEGLRVPATFLSSKDLKIISKVLLTHPDSGVVGVINNEGNFVGSTYLFCSDEAKKKLEEMGFELEEIKKGIPIYGISDSPFPLKYKEGELVEE